MAKMNPEKLKKTATQRATEKALAIDDELASHYVITKEQAARISADLTSEQVQDIGGKIVAISVYYSYVIETYLAHNPAPTTTSKLLELCPLLTNVNCPYPFKCDIATILRRAGLKVNNFGKFKAEAEEFDRAELKKAIGKLHSDYTNGKIKLAKYDKTEQDDEQKKADAEKRNATRKTPYGKVLAIKKTLENIRASKKDPCPIELITFIDDEFMPLFQWIDDGEHQLNYIVATAETAEQYQKEHPAVKRDQTEPTPTELAKEDKAS